MTATSAAPLLLTPVSGGSPLLDTVHNVDCLTLLRALPENSIDMIFTDPPYGRANIGLYEDAARLAAKTLKPGGFILAMSGGLYQNQILELMSRHLTFYWTFHVYLSASMTGAVHPGGNKPPIVTRLKPLFAFVKGWGQPRTVIYDPFAGDGNDKRFHYWGQDAKSARYYIDCFTKEGDVVLDPFCGGGTTPLVCRALNRRFIACDIDPQAVETSRARVRNEFYIPASGDQLRLEFAR